MRIDDWIHDLPARLELAAKDLDNLANADWVTTDDDRDRVFTIEAQVWRIAQTTRKASGDAAALLPFLDRSLRAVRSNVGLCLRLPVCEEPDGLELLEALVHALDVAISELSFFLRAAAERTAVVDDDDPTWIGRVAGARP
jgi:hypothetical protein